MVRFQLRLKVILSDLKNESIINWVNGEQRGFKGNEVPSYRIIKGIAIGTFMINGAATYKNASVPLNHIIPQDFVDDLVTMNFVDSISAIRNILNGEPRENVGRIVPTEIFHSIST